MQFKCVGWFASLGKISPSMGSRLVWRHCSSMLSKSQLVTLTTSNSGMNSCCWQMKMGWWGKKKTTNEKKINNEFWHVFNAHCARIIIVSNANCILNQKLPSKRNKSLEIIALVKMKTRKKRNNKSIFTYSRPIRAVSIVHVRASGCCRSSHGVYDDTSDVLDSRCSKLMECCHKRRRRPPTDSNLRATNRIQTIIDLPNRLLMDMTRCWYLLVWCCALTTNFVLGSANWGWLMCLTVGLATRCWWMVNSSDDCMCFGSTSSSGVRLVGQRTYCDSRLSCPMAIGTMMSMASMTQLCRAERPKMMDAERIAKRTATINLISFRPSVAFRVNLNVCVSEHDDSRTKLERGLRSIWCVVPILRANKHRDSGFCWTIVPILAIVRWWMLCASDVVCVSKAILVRNQCHFRRSYHHRMMNVLFQWKIDWFLR